MKHLFFNSSHEQSQKSELNKMGLTRREVRKIPAVIAILSLVVSATMLVSGNAYWLATLVMGATISAVARLLVPTKEDEYEKVEWDDSEKVVVTDEIAKRLIDGEITVEEYEGKIERTLRTAPEVVDSDESLDVTVNAILIEEKEPEERDGDTRGD